VKILETVATILAKLPPGIVEEFGRLLGDLLAGRADKAAQRARIVAETLAIKESARAPYRARKAAK
jgi:hypothetical protein